MKFSIPIRMRRNRRSDAIRKMVQEAHLKASDLIAPIFLLEGTDQKIPVQQMPGVERYSIDLALKKIEQYCLGGIQSIALFPVIKDHLKAKLPLEAWNKTGLMQRAISQIKKEFPNLCIISDVALDPYTSHGHDGIADEQGKICNDETIECLINMALAQAEAGVDFVAPSDMMDGRVRSIREALDQNGFEDVGILAYSAKYASSLYGPFRDALHVNLQFGDKKTYQMDPANAREALIEAKLDEEEGADILMVKPAVFYLDVISKLKAQTNRPIAAYQVSGEYSMIMAAHLAGYLNGPNVFYEALLSIKRAGADLIFTYAIDSILDRL